MRRSKAFPLIAALPLLSTLFSSCRTSEDPPMAMVAACDLSASIEPESRVSMFKSIESAVGTLRRGDSMAIIPVTDDAEIDSPGRILRFELPTRREVYDDDLRRVSAAARKSLEAIATQAMKEPTGHTDLLGALRVVSEELAGLSAQQLGVVVVLSDYIQDDTRFNFKTDPRLSSPATAKELAAKLAQHESHRMENVPVFLGHLSSKDLSRLSHSRRAAIEAFWLEYLNRLGARVESATDGPGLIPRFLARARNAHEPQPVASRRTR